MASRKKRVSDQGDNSGFSEFIQNVKNKPFLYLGTFLILVIISIVFIAPAGGCEGITERTFGYYNRIPIQHAPNNFFDQTFIRYAQSFQFAGDDPEIFYYLFRWAFEETAIRTGILDEMRRAGYTAPEEVVDREVAALDIFQENGRFSAARYRSLDSNARLSLWREVRESIAINHFLNDVSSLKISANEAAFITSMSSNRRSFEMVSFQLESYPESEVIAYAMSNPDLFTVIHLSMISVNTSEADAMLIMNSIRNGDMSFEDAAMNYSQDFYSDWGGDMGMQAAYELSWEIPNDADRLAVMNLNPGEMSNIIRTPFGTWAFFRANQAARPLDIEDDEQLNQVRAHMMETMRGVIEAWLFDIAEDFRVQANTLGFYEALDAMGLESMSFGPIPINYGDTALFTSIESISSMGLTELTGAGFNIFFWETAFSTPLNSVSEPRLINNDLIVLYPFEEVILDEYETSYLASYYTEWVNNTFESVYRNYILENVRFDNRFDQSFQTLFPDVARELWWIFGL